jgi:hypothetical protein
MKRFFGFALLLSLISIPALAAPKTQTVTFDGALTVGTTKLPAGDYNVTWTGTAPNVQVTLVQKDARHPATATVPAKLVDQKHSQTNFTTRTEAGAQQLEQLDFKAVSLVFTGAPVSGQ